MAWSKLWNKTLDKRENADRWFGEIADEMLNRCALVINGEHHRFIEIEFYYQDHVHPDPSVHGDSLQKSFGQWYFHRSGTSYRGGSFKGVDLTFAGSNTFGGILIRGIEKANGDVIDGPSLCVDYMLKQTNCSKVADLDKLLLDKKAWSKEIPVHIVEDKEMDQRNLVATPRVGLTLKKVDKAEEMIPYLMAGYRFLSNPQKTKKGKVYTILSLHAQGKTIEEILQIAGSTRKAIAQYIEEFEQGQKQKDFSSYIGCELNSGKLSQLYGKWWQIYA